MMANTNCTDQVLDVTGAEYDAPCRECAQLERVILLTPAFTATGADGNRRIVERAELTEFDDLDIIGTIFVLDAERIAAAAA